MHYFFDKPGKVVKGFVRKYHRLRDRLVLSSLGKLPRFQETTVHMLGLPLKVPDGASFKHMYKEIFQKGIYRFRTERANPVIIDGGANIGLSVLYFRKMHPDAQVLAFEPDPKIFAVLEANLRTFGHDDVRLVNRALWSSETELRFMRDGADAGRIARTEDPEHAAVRTVRLRDYLTEPVDFLKLDIEGAETEVLEDCREELGKVRNLFVEYHSFAAERQTLARIMSILDAAGFRVHIHDQLISPQPLLERVVCLGMDHRLNIFGMRP